MQPTPITGARLAFALDVLKAIVAHTNDLELLPEETTRHLSPEACSDAILLRLGEQMYDDIGWNLDEVDDRLDDLVRPFLRANAATLADVTLDIAPILEHLERSEREQDAFRRFFGLFATGEITEAELKAA